MKRTTRYVVLLVGLIAIGVIRDAPKAFFPLALLSATVVLFFILDRGNYR